MESCSLRIAGLLIQAWSQPAERKHRALPDYRSKTNITPNPELSFQLCPIQSDHPYLKQPGIDALIADRFGIGFYIGTGIMSGRVVIPIHNHRGALVAYAGRAVDNREPRYRFPRGFRKSIELYNLHRCTRKSVVLVEGFFDALSVMQAGFDVVALMGVVLSEQQKKLLPSRFSEVVLLLDGDDAGRRATERIANVLKQVLQVRVGVVPEARQPDCLKVDEIAKLVRSAVPMDGWRP
ncbi:MAG: toprim domain-containing protein [Acidobacteriota bacterium]|nr:toprim domain-containing protein [Acidobacteriota bacterium]